MGAELTRSESGPELSFRVWADKRRKVEVVFEGMEGLGVLELDPEPDGYFSGRTGDPALARAGTLYRLRLDDDPGLCPDPASRFQPQGPFGPSMVVDPEAFAWTDQDWPGPAASGLVLYELHVGTFTPEGSFRAAQAELAELADLGVTTIEIMPVADFPGRFGWGYDGVNPFAPSRLYGTPDDLRALVDAAHALGLSVILDVVYNHFGPDGFFLGEFSDHYLTDRYDNEWGRAINFDGPCSGPVREFILANVRHWIEEYRLDGLRLDATQQMFDASPAHIVADIARVARAAAGPRRVLLVGENESQDVSLLFDPESRGCGLDALWNDDFHHSALVALTGRIEAYYTDFRGSPQELLSCAKWGFLFQGQRHAWQSKRRGTQAFFTPASQFVHFLQNHDQVANSQRGERCHVDASPARLRAVTAFFLLMPQTPLLFMGQEFCASAPFLYFADHKPELASMVREGRMKFLTQFRRMRSTESLDRIADPGDEQTFMRCKLDFSERRTKAPMYNLHKDLLRLRREEPRFMAQRADLVFGAVLGPETLVVRYFDPRFGPEGRAHDRLLVLNLGQDLRLLVAPEPLLAPPAGMGWTELWSSEDRAYGGLSTPPLYEPDLDVGVSGWRIPRELAVVLAPTPTLMHKEHA